MFGLFKRKKKEPQEEPHTTTKIYMKYKCIGVNEEYLSNPDVTEDLESSSKGLKELIEEYNLSNKLVTLKEINEICIKEGFDVYSCLNFKEVVVKSKDGVESYSDD